MTCTVCGSNANCGCTSCTTDPALPCGCGTVTPGGCCQNVVPATPTPFYSCAPACPESHVQKITIQQFSADIKIADSWNIPGCGEPAVINAISLRAIVVGSYIWNPEFGYFEVTAFNSGTGQITVLNHCNDGNAAPGTNVPECTEFTVSDPPCACVNTSQVCVAIDFTAPANDACIDITLTTIGTIEAGDIIGIGSGRYYVDHIVSSTIINICNQGEGITPGTPVIALNSAGDYQYCISIIETCCSQIEAEFPDGLTPCTDFQYLVKVEQDQSELIVDVTIAQSETEQSNEAEIVLNNTSTCRIMQVLVTVVMDSIVNYSADGAGLGTPVYTIEESVDGGSFNGVFQTHDAYIQDSPILELNRQFTYLAKKTVAPGTLLTLTYRGSIHNVSSLGGDGIQVQNWSIIAGAIGVAA